MAITLRYRALLALLWPVWAACGALSADLEDGHGVLQPVWSSPAPDGPLLGMLQEPVGWSAGDAVVVLTPSDGWPAPLHARLGMALVASGAAVLDLRATDDLRPNLALAPEVLRRVQGAGLVVVIGHGEAGDIALDLAAGAPLDGAPTYAGAMRPGRGDGILLRDAPPGEAWAERAALLCELVATTGPGDPDFTKACRGAVAALR